MSNTDFALAIEDLTVSFDGFKAIDSLNLYVDRNELRVNRDVVFFETSATGSRGVERQGPDTAHPPREAPADARARRRPAGTKRAAGVTSPK